MTQHLLTQVLCQSEKLCPRISILLALSSVFMTGMACWLETWLSILRIFLRGANQDTFACGRWEQNGMFQPKDTGEGEPFSMAMPPPNVTGRLHMGHAMFVTLQDIMTRFARMCDRPTLWLPGTDHAGIATQVCFGEALCIRDPVPDISSSVNEMYMT